MAGNIATRRCTASVKRGAVRTKRATTSRGLTHGEVLEQAKAFCQFGASYIGWYAWDDSGYDSRTETPNNSDGSFLMELPDEIDACQAIWKG